jgi:hypothetical protein
MPTYTVRCRVDAYVDYVTEVEADSAEEAAELANGDHAAYDWRPDGQQEFDACIYLTLDVNGDEIDGTQVGDL